VFQNPFRLVFNSSLKEKNLEPLLETEIDLPHVVVMTNLEPTHKVTTGPEKKSK
jgi:hypothetical protein